MNIQPIVLAAIIIAVLIVAGLVGWFLNMRMRSQLLKRKFGPEYD